MKHKKYIEADKILVLALLLREKGQKGKYLDPDGLVYFTNRLIEYTEKHSVSICYVKDVTGGTMAEHVKMKPCPFCGGEAEISIRFGAIPTKYVQCKTCKACTGYYAYVISDDSLAEKWNQRVET